MKCLSRTAVLGNVNEYKSRRDAQKYFIDFILMYGDIDLVSLAQLLDIDLSLMSDVLSGKQFLEGESTIRLVQYFLMMFTELP